MEGKTVDECLSGLRDQLDGLVFVSSEQTAFAAELLAAIHHLAANIGKQWFQSATLTAMPLTAPCSQINANSESKSASLIAFKAISEAHDFTHFNTLYEYVPNPLFLASQHVYTGSPDNVPFANAFRKELEGLVHRSSRSRGDTTADSISSQQPSPLQSRHGSLMSRKIPRLTIKQTFPFLERRLREKEMDDNSSQREMFSSRSSWPIRANSKMTSTSTETGIGDQGENQPAHESTAFNEDISAEPADSETYADQLMILTKQGRRLLNPESSSAWP